MKTQQEQYEAETGLKVHGLDGKASWRNPDYTNHLEAKCDRFEEELEAQLISYQRRLEEIDVLEADNAEMLEALRTLWHQINKWQCAKYPTE